jgi:hypothetical protein
VSTASETMNRVYVERQSDLYRWSPAHSGGSYPLLRITALFLGADHQRIYIGFRTLPDGTSILCEDPGVVEEPDRWMLLDVSEPINHIETIQLIRANLSPEQTW